MDNQLATVLHRMKLGQRIAELMKANAPVRLVMAAWRVFCRLAQATGMMPQQAFAQVLA